MLDNKVYGTTIAYYVDPGFERRPFNLKTTRQFIEPDFILVSCNVVVVHVRTPDP